MHTVGENNQVTWISAGNQEDGMEYGKEDSQSTRCDKGIIHELVTLKIDNIF